MIPWTAFHGSQSKHLDCHGALNEVNLYYFVPSDLSPLDRALEIPMLELAHERQFAVSQLALGNQAFEEQHTSRIDTFLQDLSQHFSHHSITLSEPAASRHMDDVADLCRSAPTNPSTLPTFEISSDEEQYEPVMPKSPTPNPTSVRTTPPLSQRISPPLAIKDLMNPEPQEDLKFPNFNVPLLPPIEPDTDHHYYENYASIKATIRRAAHTRPLDRHQNNRRAPRSHKDTRLRRQSKLRSSMSTGTEKLEKHFEKNISQQASSSRNSSMEID